MTGRDAVLVVGLTLLAGLWAGPLPWLAPHSFSAHMALHMGVVAVAAPLVALGLAGRRADPARRWPAIFNPVAASVVELLVVWGWHAPALHHAARHRFDVFVAEQSMFLAAGLWLWLAAFGGARAARRSRAWTGVAGLLFTSIHMTLLGALFALTPRPLYADGAANGAALGDQHLGGGIMLLVGGVSYLAGGLWLAVEGLRRSAAPSRSAA